ncbi:hypothetical protein ACFE04_009077 [Oxalis oulophora]
MSNSWRNIHPHAIPRFIGSAKGSVSTRGYVHWLCLDEMSEKTVCSFNLETEEFTTTICPKPIGGHQSTYILNLLEQSLAIVYFGSRGDSIEVWILKDYKCTNTWTQQFQTTRLRNQYIENGLLPPKILWLPLSSRSLIFCNNRGDGRQEPPNERVQNVPIRVLCEWNDGFLFETKGGRSYMIYYPYNHRIEFLNAVSQTRQVHLLPA